MGSSDRSNATPVTPIEAVGPFGAMAIGEWFEAATVSFLFALSLAIESWSVGRARRAIAARPAPRPRKTRDIRQTTGNLG
jgi:Cd2+/Zn2+-exporting ATPase